MLAEWSSTFDDIDTIETALAEHGLAMGVLRTVDEISHTDWAEARGAIVEVDDRSGGTLRIPNSPWRFSGADTGVRGVPAYRGEHNREVLQRAARRLRPRARPPRGRGRALESTAPRLTAAAMALRWGIAPMKAVSSDVVPTDDGWDFEIKWDGNRVIAFVDEGKVRLQSSNKLDSTARWPELADVGGGRQREGRDPRRRDGRVRREGPSRASAACRQARGR